ncbi:MAG: AraC family transcriptional regulator [Moraxella sp.]|nr:AraC family transcriptional regulator [Moraxella sp.]
MNLNTLDIVLHHTTRYNKPCPTNIDGIIINAVKPPIYLNKLIEYTVISFVLSGDDHRVILGGQSYLIQAGHAYFVPFEMPITVQFKNQNQPKFLSISMILQETWLSQIIQKYHLNTPNKHHATPPSGVAVSAMNQATKNCLVRLIELLDNPNPALSELYKQELVIHLLGTPLGEHLIAFTNQNSQLQKIKRVSDHLQKHWADKLVMADLAHLVGMGESSFFSHFKAITGFSPLQYQKSLRLNYAKEMILKGDLSISQIAYNVGYESMSQFSREYKRQFGVSPSDTHQP